ncbi:unnamed protein product, partial [Musa textilis]
MILASSNELLWQALIFLNNLRELPTNLPVNFRKPFGKLPIHYRPVPTALPMNLRTFVKLSNSQRSITLIF